MFEELKQRALKITEALYRTTDLFSDAEPLKWSLRQGGLDILNSVSLLESAGYEKAREVSRLEILIKNAFLKLELAASGTFISKMNFEVLRREYGALLDKVMSVKDSYQKLLDSIVSDQKPTEIAVSVRNLVSDSISEKPDKPNNGHRQGFLLSALKERGQASVGDLAKALTGAGFGVSEKTVQRELNSLVSSGAIKQEGEKRWRKYLSTE